MTQLDSTAWYESKTALFRRQYMVTPAALEGFAGWDHAQFGPLHICKHPDLELTMQVNASGEATTGVALLGFALDPDEPAATNGDIVAGMLASDYSATSVTRHLHRLSGRFAVFVLGAHGAFVVNDACGLRPVYYVRAERGLYCSSNPLLLRETLDLPFTDAYRVFVHSQFFRTDKEYWLPTDSELIQGVRQLVPNHLLELGDGRQRRFWPRAEIAALGVATAADRASQNPLGRRQRARPAR